MIVAGVITTPGIYFMLQDILLTHVRYCSGQIGFVEVATSLLIMLTLGMATIMFQT